MSQHTQGMYNAHVAARDPANAMGMFLQVLNDHQQALEWLQVCVCACVCLYVRGCWDVGWRVADVPLVSFSWRGPHGRSSYMHIAGIVSQG